MCGGVEVEIDGRVLPDALIGGRQGRLVLAYLVCERDRAVRREELADLLWPDRLPDSWAASLSAVISRLRRLFSEAGLDGQSAITSTPGSYQLILPAGSRIDLEDLAAAVATAEDAAAGGDVDRALAAAADAEAIAARGFLADDCEWVDARRDAVRDLRVRAAIAQSVTHLRAAAAGRSIEAARRAVDLDPAKEAAHRQLMRALGAAGERGEALRVWERCRITLVEDLGIEPSPETEAVYRQLIDTTPPPTTTELPSGVVTFLLTDIVESSALWEENPAAMAKALERHDAIIGETVAAHGGTLLKSKLEGDATVSVFARATGAVTGALALLDALAGEPWPAGAAPRLRMAMHTGEAFERGGDYFGPALNRAARLRGLAGADEVLCSQAVAELVRDHLPPDTTLHDRGHRNLRGLSRGENVFQLVRSAAGEVSTAPHRNVPTITQPPVPAALAGAGPFVGRKDELRELVALWDQCVAGRPRAGLIGGEPGVGKSRLAGEIARRAHAAGALVLYGRCDEDLAAPLQPFIEAVRVLAPALGAARLRQLRGVDELTRVVPEVADLLPESAPAVRADPDTQRLALFDAVTQLLVGASREAPVLLVLDDLHWAGKTTLSLLRHLLRGAKESRLLVVGTYRDTELARTHPLAATLADLRRDSDTHRIALGGLGAAEVEAYLAAIGNTDRALGRELAEITSGNPFFLIEVVRHVEESGGAWQPGTLPEGVREATGRRLSRLSDAANDALAVAAVAGTTFDLALVEQVQGVELVDPIAEACQAGLVMEEPGTLGRFRFAHALVRQVLLAELVSLKRVRLHRTIAELLETAPPAADADARLADLAYHWYECASTGSADRAVIACRHAADRAMERVAYEEAGDLYAMALQALEWIDDADPETRAALHLARCDALLTAGDVTGARGAIDALELAAAGSERLAAWYTTYEGLLAVLAEPDRLTEIVRSIGAAAGAMRAVGDLIGEAKAHYVHASALERLGQIGAAERALDAALAAARAADDRRLADAILAEAPPAALWGPSSVTRASGRCLDVVRVLRITSGAPAVEAVALRCQAVLEALRGRMDAARRMISSARRTVEQLGLTHRRLETEVAAGFIELLDGQAVAAEAHLRIAYDELRERRLDGEAAQAGAFLGRALLLQDRVDDADEVAAVAESLAGSDLKAAIAWRGVRAEVAARRGDTEHALSIAREAVELATATDALLLIVDARMALATVLRTAGDRVGADAEARRAVEACDLKGATVLAARARLGLPHEAQATPVGAQGPAATGKGPSENLAYAWCVQFQELFNRADWDAIRTILAPTFTRDDRRHYVAMTVGREDEFSEQFVYEAGGRAGPPELIATLGRRAALCRQRHRAPEWESVHLAVVLVDEEAHVIQYVLFEPEAMDDAMAALDELATASPAASPFENDATRTLARIHGAFNDQDWDALLANYSPAYTTDDGRPIVGRSLDVEQSIAGLRVVFDGRGQFEDETVATRGRTLALTRTTLRVPAPEATATVLIATEVDADGLFLHSALFEPSDVDSAIAALDAMYLAGEGAEHADVARLAASLFDAMERHDTAAVGALFGPGIVVRDHRRASATALPADQWLERLDDTFALWGSGTLRVEHVADLSGNGGLWAAVSTGTHETGGAYEVPWLVTLRVANGLIGSYDLYDEYDIAAARAALAPVHGDSAERFANTAWRTTVRVRDACIRRDWQGFLDALDHGFVYADRRHGMQLHLEGDDALFGFRVIHALDQVTWEGALLATRGDQLALTREHVWFVDGDAGPAEVENLALQECTRQGLSVSSTGFNPDELDAAYDALDARFAELGGPDLRPYRRAFDRHDWDRFGALFSEDCTLDDHRVGLHCVGRDEFLAYERGMLDAAPDAVMRIHHVLGRSTHHTLTVGGYVGTRDGGPFESQDASVTTRGRDDRITAVQVYSLDNLDAARAEYNRLSAPPVDHVAGNLAWHVATRFGDTSNRRDRHAFVALLAPHFELDDRRTGVSMVERGIRTITTVFDIDEYRIDRRLLATRGDLLALVEDHVTLQDGMVGAAVVDCLTLVEADADSRLVRHTAFEIGDMNGALGELDARHAELDTPMTDSPLVDLFENAATRATRRGQDASNAQDLRAFLATVSPTFTCHDRRSGVATSYVGEDALAWTQGRFDLDEFRLDRHVVATRGESLALERVVATFRDGLTGPAEVECLGVVETDSEGQVAAAVLFDADDTTAALDELDARDIARGGNPMGATLRHGFDARDWETVASVLTPDCTFGDYRTAGWGRIDRNAFVAYQRGLVELAPDAHLWTDHERSQGNVNISIGRAFGTRAGGPWEIAFATVAVTQEDHRASHIETYELTDVARAQERFGELIAREAGQGVGNLAWRTAERQARCINTRNWEALVHSLAPDTVVDNRRSGVALVLRGEQVLRSVHRVAFTLDRFRIDHELVATRGDRLALVHATATFEDGDAGPAEITCFNLFQVDEHGRLATLLSFDIDDLAGAQHELDARATPQSVGNLAWRVAQAHAEHVNTGNWDALAASLATGFEDDDRRSAVALVTRGEQARSIYRTLFDLDHCRQARELVAVRGDRLALVRSTVTFEDGVAGVAEVVSLNLLEVDERGLVTRSIKFNVDDLTAAHDELEARGAALATEDHGA